MFRPAAVSNPKTLFIAAVNAFVIVCLTLFTYYISSKQYQPTVPYEQAQLLFSTQDEDEQKKFAVREGKAKFLFASGAPKSIGTTLFFHSTGEIRVSIESQYKSTQCSEKGKGNAIISFSTPVESYSKPLGTVPVELILPILAGDRVGVQVTNHKQANCGRARIKLSQDSHLIRYVLLFPLIWLSILAFLTRFNLGFLALWGSGIHASYILSETLYGQAMQAHFGFTALIALLGIGLVLFPLCFRLLKPVAFAFYILSLIFILGLPVLNIGNYWAFSGPIDTNSIHAILQTNSSELTQFLNDSFSRAMLFMVSLSLLALVIFAIQTLRAARTTFAISGLGMLLIALSVSLYPQFSANIATLKIWKNSTFSYFRELDAFNKLRHQRSQLSVDYQLTRAGSPRVTVLVIGESHNKNHMSLYGYPRVTTPALDNRANNDSLIVLKNAYSNHTHTTPTLSLALTQANQYNDINWFQSPSILDLAKQSNIQTYWLSNQQMLGAWDNQVALIAQEANQVVAINKKVGVYKQPDKFDEALLKPFQQSLEGSGEKLIVLHLMGNHATYCMRYPKDWEKFSGDLDTQHFGRLNQTSDVDKINCYDNSVAYNDYVLDRLYAILEESSLSASVFYFADHSEDIFNGKAHNQANFDFSMTEIPTFVWATDSWKQENLPLWEQLVHNREKVFTNDLVFETLLGLMGLQGKSLDLSKDLSSANYTEPTTPTTLHGRININSSQNKIFWQKINGKMVSENGLSARLIPHRVNTLGKMSDIASTGITSFEVDVYFRTANQEVFFEVGHDKATMSGIRLEDFLAELPEEFEKIWLDVKNAGPNNVNKIANKLDELDVKFSIKHRTIVETGDPSEAPKLLVERGYHVSYYLPTNEILAVMQESEQSRLELADKLARVVRLQNSSAVSFDLRLYDFVKNHLEPLLKSGIYYHTWSPGISFGNNKLLEKINERPYFKDPRVKTILLPYSSNFSL